MSHRTYDRRQLLKISAGAGAAALAAPSVVRASRAQVSGKIVFVIWADAVETASWDPIVAKFNETQPDIQVEVQAVPAESWAGFFDAVSTRIAGGDVPDVMRVATEGQRLFASRGLVEPLDDYLERDKAELQDFFDDVHPNLVEWTKTLSSTDGKTYYVPHGFNTMCLWYHTEMFAAAGVEEPTDEWTWDDFQAAAKALTKPGVYGFHMPPAYFAGVMPWLLTNGASTLSDDWTESTVAEPAAIESAQFMASLVADGISPKPGGEFDAFATMAQGKLAMFGGGRWPTAAIREAKLVDKVKLVAWPRKTQQGSPVGWDGHPIMQASQNKDAAWEFVKFLASADAQSIEVGQGGPTVPPRRSLAKSEAFLKDAPEGMDKLYDALDYATPIPSPDAGNIIEQDIIDTFTQILAGNQDPEEALKTLDQQISAEL
ncbi:MAG TPA: sugar ABC transporter substrate-binding protein [Thermomicrobiales bacterium]|nr:sugar ABC transporter substrate-binding protein [Thermomicrobiales bacterium]